MTFRKEMVQLMAGYHPWNVDISDFSLEKRLSKKPPENYRVRSLEGLEKLIKHISGYSVSIPSDATEKLSKYAGKYCISFVDSPYIKAYYAYLDGVTSIAYSDSGLGILIRERKEAEKSNLPPFNMGCGRILGIASFVTLSEDEVAVIQIQPAYWIESQQPEKTLRELRAVEWDFRKLPYKRRKNRHIAPFNKKRMRARERGLNPYELPGFEDYMIRLLEEILSDAGFKKLYILPGERMQWTRIKYQDGRPHMTVEHAVEVYDNVAMRMGYRMNEDYMLWEKQLA